MWNCTHFRNPTEEQLRISDIVRSNIYLQSVPFESNRNIFRLTDTVVFFAHEAARFFSDKGCNSPHFCYISDITYSSSHRGTQKKVNVGVSGRPNRRNKARHRVNKALD